VSPENYLEKIIQEKPDTLVLIDAVDFSGKPGEFKFLQVQDIKTVNLFATHNASISLTINYLQNNLKADIIILIIQPKNINFGDKLSREVADTLDKLEALFL
jgi:hydrogenase 3 maturation protease